MNYHIMTKKQMNVFKKTNKIVKWLLSPIWIPIYLIMYVLDFVVEITEKVVFEWMEDKIEGAISWVVRKTIKK